MYKYAYIGFCHDCRSHNGHCINIGRYLCEILPYRNPFYSKYCGN